MVMMMDGIETFSRAEQEVHILFLHHNLVARSMTFIEKGRGSIRPLVYIPWCKVCCICGVAQSRRNSQSAQLRPWGRALSRCLRPLMCRCSQARQTVHQCPQIWRCIVEEAWPLRIVKMKLPCTDRR